MINSEHEDRRCRHRECRRTAHALDRNVAAGDGHRTGTAGTAAKEHARRQKMQTEDTGWKMQDGRTGEAEDRTGIGQARRQKIR